MTVLPLAMAYGAVIVLALRRSGWHGGPACARGVEPLAAVRAGQRLRGLPEPMLALLDSGVAGVLAQLFNADNVTQFYGYYDNMHSAHHPLLHTQLLGGR